MIDDSPKPNPAQLTEEDASFLASLLMGTATAPSAPAVVDLTSDGEVVVDLTEKPGPIASAPEALEDPGKDSPTLTFTPETGMSDILGGTGRGRVSDLVDVASVLAARPSPEVISRSVFGLPEPGAATLAVRQDADDTLVAPAVAPAANEVRQTGGPNHGWFRPAATATTTATAATTSAPVEEREDLFAAPARDTSNVIVRLDTATSGQGADAVVFSAGTLPAERRRKVLLAALFIGAVAIGGGLVALLANGGFGGDTTDPSPAVAEVVTTQAPATSAPSTEVPATVAPTTAAPATTAAPTTAAPTTTVAPTTTIAPTTEAPTTTATPTTRAPRTTQRPATTRPPTTVPTTTEAPPQTFAPPTWADPLE